MHDEAWPQELLVLSCRVEGLLCSSLLLKEDKPSTAPLSQSWVPWPSALPALIAQEQSLLLARWLWAGWWQTLSLHQEFLLCQHYIIWSFLPSLQRKGFYV